MKKNNGVTATIARRRSNTISRWEVEGGRGEAGSMWRTEAARSGVLVELVELWVIDGAEGKRGIGTDRS
jgi:hypothetical protein